MKPSQNQPRISAMQLSFILIANRLSVLTVFLPTLWDAKNSRDTWISALLSGIGGMVITYIVVTLSKRHSKLTLIQICTTLFGKWIGGFISLVYLWFFLHISLITIRAFAEILNTALMPETPIQIFIIYVVLAVVFSVYRGLEAIARTNLLILPGSMISLLLILILLAKDFHLELLKPILENGWKPIMMGTILPIAFFGEGILISMLYPYVEDKQKVMKYSMGAILIGTFFLTILSMAVISIFGPIESANLTLAVYSLVRMISIGHFLERIEAIMVAVWIGLLFIKICIFLYAGVRGTGQLLNLKLNKFLIIPFSCIALILSYTSFKNLSEIKLYFSPKQWGIYSLTLEFLIPCILLVVSFFRKRKNAI
ncbi:endospore germination permease [Bacillus sp. RG28]|uniref:Endospore germination permease n=1 Tax=Gottfriedia endophytica TaxID=2820819 RepID=A0A940NGU5_9BACI|nr:endospore germination permease [Gottfriedia endophytica]MBP0725154.1 endospore germination permease [Gottfriedia endophytica]